MNLQERGTGGHDVGAAIVDLLIATVVVAAMAALAAPVTKHASDSGRARAAAGYLAGRLRLTRILAVRTATATALVFDGGDGWSFRVCRDGNGNGVRRADIDSREDPCESREVIGDRFGGITIGLDPTVPDLDRVAGRDDGVRFGRGAMASCGPTGHCTPGSLYLQSAGGTHYGLRVSGLTGRTRRLRFDAGSNDWTPD